MKVENKWCPTHQRNSKTKKNSAKITNVILKVEKNSAQNTNVVVKVENK